MKKIALLTLAFAAIATFAQAQEKAQDKQTRVIRTERTDGRAPRVLVQKFDGEGMGIPNLSQEQKDQMKQLRIAAMKETTATRNLIAEKRAHLTTLQANDKADMSAINKTIDEIASLQAQQMKAQAACSVKVRALLNDEQKVAFDSRKNMRFNFNRGFNFDKGALQGKVRAFRMGDNTIDIQGLEGLESLGDLGNLNYFDELKNFGNLNEEMFEFNFESEE